MAQPTRLPSGAATTASIPRLPIDPELPDRVGPAFPTETYTPVRVLPEPPKDRPPHVWPNWPMILRTSSSHEEGVVRDFSINTKGFVDDGRGNVKALKGVRLEWTTDNGRPVMKEEPGSEFEIPCELVLLALGFLGPEPDTMIAQLGCALTNRGNVKVAPDYQTTVPGVFACGDMRRGQSLVVLAIWEGRECARGVDDTWLMGETSLPTSPEL